MYVKNWNLVWGHEFGSNEHILKACDFTIVEIESKVMTLYTTKLLCCVVPSQDWYYFSFKTMFLDYNQTICYSHLEIVSELHILRFSWLQLPWNGLTCRCYLKYLKFTGRNIWNLLVEIFEIYWENCKLKQEKKMTKITTNILGRC